MSGYDSIKNSTTAKDILADLKGITLTQEKGERYTGECFKCGPSKSGTKFRAFDSGFVCFGCGVKGNLVELVKEIKNISEIEAYKLLLKKYVNKERYTKKTFKNYEKKKKTNFLDGALYESLFEYGKVLLFKSDGKDVLKYLTESRNYNIKKIKDSDFFYMPSIAKCKTYLISKFPKKKEYINSELSLKGAFKKNFPLGICYRDEGEVITGFIFRSIKPKGEVVEEYDKASKGYVESKDLKRYNSTKGVNKSSLFNIYKNKKSLEILVVEGYPDATYLSTYSGVNVCAVGQAELRNSHIQSIIHCNVSNVVLSLDNDAIKDGENKTESEKFYFKRRRILNALKKLASYDLNVCIVDPNSLRDVKDIDEEYRKRGIKGVKGVLAEKQECVDYLIFLIEKQSELEIQESTSSFDNIQFSIEKYLEYREMVNQNRLEEYRSKFLIKITGSNFTEENLIRLEGADVSVNGLNEEELLSGLDKLLEIEAKKIKFIGDNKMLFKEIFSSDNQIVFAHIYKEQGEGHLLEKLDEGGKAIHREIKQNSFIKLLSDKLLEKMVLISFRNKLIKFYENQIKKASTMSFQSIDEYYESLNYLSEMCEKISELISNEN